MTYNKVKLNQICDLQNGYAFKSSDYIDNSDTLNCRMSNIRPDGGFNIEYNPKYLPNEFATKYKKYLLKDGDIVIAMTDMANDPKILGVPTIVNTLGKNLLLNQRVGKLILRDSNKVDIKFLQYALNRPAVKLYFKKFAGGGVQINIGKKEILGVSIPLPPLPEQQRIARILDHADALRQKHQQLLEEYDRLLESVFLEMFGDPVVNPKGWKKVKLGKLTNMVGSGSTPKGGQSVYQREGFVFIRSQNVRNNIVDYQDIYYISKEIHNKMKRTWLKKNDVLLNITGASIGRAAIYKGENDMGNVNQHVCIIRLNQKLATSTFMLFHLVQKNFQNQIISSNAGGTREAFNFKQIKNFKIILPPIKLQNQFASVVQNIEAQKAKVQQALEESEGLFGGLLQRAFRGEL